MNYFYFSRGQKIGIIVLFCIIAALIVVNESLPYLIKEKPTEDAAFMEEVALFKASLKDIPPKTYNYETGFPEKKLIAFNPNTLDSVGFVALGIRPKVARNIVKYRAKGGKFKTPEDFSKIYGISESQYNELYPYITIPSEKLTIKEEKITPKKEFERSREFERKIVMVELNSADTTELKKLRGIGSVFANRIVAHRDKLGGFVDIEQLKEIRGFTLEKFDEIADFVTADASQITKIAVNKLTIDELRMHPYLNYRVSKAIYEQRKNLRRLISRNDLENLPDLPIETLEKILPYLCFK